MNKIIIGSQALKHWFPEANIQPKDKDYAVPLGSKSTREVEYLYNPILFLEKYQHLTVDGYLIPDALYTLKMSHMFWNISWNKNMYYIQLMKDLGCKVIRELFYDLYAFWTEYHGVNKRSNLDLDAEAFFNNALDYPVDHDTLHELLIQHPYFENQDKPTYTKILIGEVDVCMDKFEQLSFKEKFNVVFEEVACMGVERCKPSMKYRQVFDIMLKSFVQKHCKLSEAIWILDNYNFVTRNIPFDFKEYLYSKVYEEEKV